MLTNERLQQILTKGYWIADADFVAHMVENMPRSIFLMSQILSEHRYRYVASNDLQKQINASLKKRGVPPPQQRFNSVDWLSAEWTTFDKPGGKASQYFDPDYKELFDRDGENPTNYRLKSKWYDAVVAIIATLDGTSETSANAEASASANMHLPVIASATDAGERIGTHSEQHLTTEQVQTALSTLASDPSVKTQSGFKMLRANYRVPGRQISATRLALAAGYDDYSTGNEQYGSFAHRICEITEFVPLERRDGSPIWTYAICQASEEKDNNGHFQWVLRDEVAVAMENLGIVEIIETRDALDDIAAKLPDLEGFPLKDRERLQKARIGQGVFRERLIKHWGRCAVTECDQLDLLVASHIKPWRDCTAQEALDMPNGLLLVPNLDQAFDHGFISFDDAGAILISPQLTADAATVLGISATMKLDHVFPQHRFYLQHHREYVYRKTS